MGGQDPEVAGFLSMYLHSLSFVSYGLIYKSLESLFHDEYKAIEIVEIGSNSYGDIHVLVLSAAMDI